ncbi:MAG TPA: FkbM family methyltransferase, partial [Catalimonadaceae bacterium]|nr:FkbM family methyltransferase [Catalimonadaceae bacterium]
MLIQSLKEQFQANQIDKWTYIDQMYAQHSLFFDYARFLEDTNISKIEIENGRVIMTFRDSGVRFICSQGDKRLAPFESLNFGDYESEELHMQQRLIEDGQCVLDIGGNYGWYCMHMAKKFPKAHIFSFEPIPHTHQLMVENLAVNGIQNVDALKFGLSDADGSFQFYYDPALSVNASLKNLTGKNTVEGVACEVKTLDGYWANRNEAIHFIKCDVEGAELLVYKGAPKTLQVHKPIIFSEMLRKWTAQFGYHPNDIIDYLAGFGYQPYVLSGKGLKVFGRVDDNTRETNYFFLH